jgi:heme exporter protein D
MNEFFYMGGYAAYVWPSYFLAFIVLVLNLVAPFYCARRVKRMLVRKARLARRPL